MSIKAFRTLPFLICMLIVTGAFAVLAYARDNPVGVWEGTVSGGHRNVVVILKVTKLQLGAPSGEMRWGTPRTCSLQIDYSGVRASEYTFNIFGTNGGWCDLYRDGTLSLQIAPAGSNTLTFDLVDKRSGEPVKGTLTASMAKALKAAATIRVTNRNALIVRGVNVVACDANGLALGSDPKVKPNQDVQNLSVNCDPDGGNVHELRKGLPQAHVCWATLKHLETRNTHVIVQTDPLKNNLKHCLVRDITPNEMVKALHYKS